MRLSRADTNRHLIDLVRGRSGAARVVSGGPGLVYGLKVTLLGAREPVWRGVHVRGEISLRSLNSVIRRVLGWPEDNAYRLDVVWWKGGQQGVIERKARVCDLVSVGDILVYGYEYGWGWKVETLVEEVVPAGRRAAPVCVSGAGASPFQPHRWDNYDRWCALRDHGHEIAETDLGERRRQVEEGGEPFDLDRVNAVLRRGRYRLGTATVRLRLGSRWRRLRRAAAASARRK